MSSEKTKQAWEPSDASVAAACIQRYGGQLWARKPESWRAFERSNMRATLIAAVAADPLLSAAKDMQDALAALSDAVHVVFGDKWTDTLLSNVLPIADDALAKSHGEG